MSYRARPLPNPDCPEAYGDCTCACHRQPGIKHVMPCCHPNRQPEKTMPPPTVSVIIHSPPTCGATFVQTQIIAALTSLGLNVSAPPGNLGRREVKNRTENPERFVDALRAKGVSVVVEVRQVPRGKKL